MAANSLVQMSVYEIELNPQTGDWTVSTVQQQLHPPSRIRLVSEWRPQGLPEIYAKVVFNEPDMKEIYVAETVAALLAAANQ